MEKEPRDEVYRPVCEVANTPVNPIIDLSNLDLCDHCKSILLAEFLRSYFGLTERKK